jgi:imidazole glycerol-phosphate synthase subunit HisH
VIAVLKYNAGNVQSVIYALHRLGAEAIITDDEEMLLRADKVIFPGVGAAGTTMTYLKENKLDEVIRNIKNPLLGICLGMQLLCKHSEENNTECLGIFDVNVKLFPPKEKVPHIGWNNLKDCKGKLFNNVSESSDVYFVHSYYAEQNENSIADCDYILPFSAAIQKDNFYAVQFHAEKSGEAGEKILKNFLEL